MNPKQINHTPSSIEACAPMKKHTILTVVIATRAILKSSNTVVSTSNRIVTKPDITNNSRGWKVMGEVLEKVKGMKRFLSLHIRW